MLWSPAQAWPRVGWGTRYKQPPKLPRRDPLHSHSSPEPRRKCGEHPSPMLSLSLKRWYLFKVLTLKSPLIIVASSLEIRKNNNIKLFWIPRVCVCVNTKYLSWLACWLDIEGKGQRKTWRLEGREKDGAGVREPDRRHRSAAWEVWGAWGWLVLAFPGGKDKGVWVLCFSGGRRARQARPGKKQIGNIGEKAFW